MAIHEPIVSPGLPRHGRIDTLLCVHRRDVGYLFPLVLASHARRFLPAGRITIVTNDPAGVQAVVTEQGVRADVLNDGCLLSSAEQALPGWFRQQVIKLRAHEIATGPICALGSDALVLRPVVPGDLLAGGMPILRYTPHRIPWPHRSFEEGRVRNVAAMLGVRPDRSLRYADVICDLFTFDRDVLVDLDRHLHRRHGPHALASLLRDLPARGNGFGEQTIYSVFALDVLGLDLPIRTTAGFVEQITHRWQLPFARFDASVVHIVGKHFDIDAIERRITARPDSQSGAGELVLQRRKAVVAGTQIGQVRRPAGSHAEPGAQIA